MYQILINDLQILYFIVLLQYNDIISAKSLLTLINNASLPFLYQQLNKTLFI